MGELYYWSLRPRFLITDNGPFGFQLLHPQYHVDKTCHVQVTGLLNNQAIETFQQGVRFRDGKVCVAQLITILLPPVLWHKLAPSQRKISPSEENV